MSSTASLVITRRARTMMAGLVLAAATVCAACLGGCAGYRVATAYRSDVGTIAVPVFGNASYDYGIEAELTEAIIKEIHRVTPYRVTGEPGADTVLAGSIASVDRRALARDSDTGLVEEQAVQLTVNFEWKRAASGEVLAARRGFSSADTFVPDIAARETYQLGRRRAIDRLARDIVAELRSGF